MYWCKAKMAKEKTFITLLGIKEVDIPYNMMWVL
jgi:hypothetical protein